MEEKKENPVVIPGRLSLDHSPGNQPPGTLRFALNTVAETEEGQIGKRTIEEANALAFNFPENFVPLGSTSIGNDETAIFLADGTSSIILIKHPDNTTTIVVDDRTQSEKIGFKPTQQIDVIFRLRRGCERVLYWVDPAVRYFNIDRPEKFKDQNGDWLVNAFSLTRKIEKMPVFQNLQVLSSGGTIPPGSYNFLVQYLDEDLNATEFITSSEVINIYRTNSQDTFRKIRGSSNVDSAYYTKETTTKAIRISLSNLDSVNFTFYRIAVAIANNGSGQVSEVRYSDPIPTTVPVSTYTGINYVQIGTQEELIAISAAIEEAEHIDQVDNMLLLSNVKGEQAKFCEFQKYASRINVDVATKTVQLNVPVGANSKNPLAKFEGIGYMPGEIYSLGIVYILEGNIQTPVYHIAGKNDSYPPGTVFSPGPGIYPMSLDNKSADTKYVDNSSCGESLWGVDSFGAELKNTSVRHHRFPKRSELGIPLFEEVSQNQIESEQWGIYIEISGDITIPELCDEEDPDCQEPDIADLEDIQIEIDYEDAEGNTYTFIDGINYELWDDSAYAEGEPGQIIYGPVLTTSSLTITEVRETSDSGTVIVVLTAGVGTSSNTGITYTIVPTQQIGLFAEKRYETKILGLKFSNVIIPPASQIGGKEVIGYFFVRNERTEEERTIVDSGVLGPMLQNKEFVSHGLLCPELNSNADTRLNKRFMSLIHPAHKFEGTTYDTVSEIVHEGDFRIKNRHYSRFIVEDVVDGTTYRRRRHKRSEKDDDGWQLHVKTRDNELEYSSSFGETLFDNSQIKEIFYLSSLESKLIEETAGNPRDVFNISGDNRVGVIALNSNYLQLEFNRFPYVLLKRDNTNPYSSFRTSPYYKISKNFHSVTSTVQENVVWGGDSYINSLKYVNSVFIDAKPRRRRSRRGILSIVIGVFGAVVGVLISVFTLGIGTPIGLAVASAAVGLGAAMASSGIRQESWMRAYYELYNKGLRETGLDNLSSVFTKHPNTVLTGNSLDDMRLLNPTDDEFQWIGDAAEFWFESHVNIGLRTGANIGIITDFMDSPGFFMVGNTPVTGKNRVPATTELDKHMYSKLTYLDTERKKESRGYFGIAQAELYDINPDYQRENKQKVYNALPLEYDCCSSCLEDFPHRIFYSLQSFEEELTDNYRVFLPNNYKDIQGDTGEITDMFVIKNNIFIHTQHALWHLPQNFQERVTGDIISFLGTGEYFSTPPRKIVDDQKDSAGTLHKWGRLKTKYGVIFPCAKEGKIFLFNGEGLQPISEQELGSYFREQMSFVIEDKYYQSNKGKYPFSNNNSHPLGVGYLSAFDGKKERLLITKRDKDPINLPEGGDYILCGESGGTIIIEDVSTKIAQKEAEGFTYVGVENCALKFEKTVMVPETIEVEVFSRIPPDTIIVPFYDSSSMNSSDIDNLRSTLEFWFPIYKASINGGDNNLSFVDPGTWNVWSAENWVTYPAQACITNIGVDKNVLLLVFVDESEPIYHGNTISTPMSNPTAQYITDMNHFINNLYPQFSSFLAINYPIVRNTNNCKEYLIHAIGAIDAKFFTMAEVNAIEYNSNFTGGEWVTLMSNLMANKYANEGLPSLRDYGWLYKTNRVAGVNQNSGPTCPASPSFVITPCQFTKDIEDLLKDVTTVTTQEVEILVPTTEIEYVTGFPFGLIYEENSWTASFSFREAGWISWHSYLPAYYIGETNKVFSWVHGTPSFYEHNFRGKYAEYYGVKYPHIIEFVSNYSPTDTKIFDTITIQTEALIWKTQEKTFSETKSITFNKALFYNSYQISGVKDIVVKRIDPYAEVLNYAGYMTDQILNNPGVILADYREGNWNLNNMRDYRKQNYAGAMFKKDLASLSSSYYIDKIVNPDAIDLQKNWTELESFRDKYLVVRLIFDNFDNVRLSTHFSLPDIKPSE